jgi:hypothetical protein
MQTQGTTVTEAGLDIADAGSADRMLRHFNGFQDSFIKRLELVSHDEFEEPGAQNCTGILDLNILFMHHNFGTKREVRAVQMLFRGVSDLRLSTSGQTFEWHVSSLEISSGERPVFGEWNEACLVAEVNSPRRANALKPVPSLLFRFERLRVTDK